MTSIRIPHTLKNIGPLHAPAIDPSTPKLCIANKVNIKVSEPQGHYTPAIIHEPPIIYQSQSYNQFDKRTGAVVLVSGAGGGVSGPGGIYPSLADKIALLLSIPCIRLDYRTPAEKGPCIADIHAALDHLHEKYGAQNFLLYGDRGDRRIRLFPGDDHGLTRNAVLVERKIFVFAARCLGLQRIVDGDVLEQAGIDLVGGREERVKEMELGRDLENGERLF
ncbi:hypothetical protein N7520_005230 [Penicillium odoratum]|uniref:uncharacterized protein n=1 Tax=Penicillium odoratum TaxID=1167516 RepID=UPI00254753A7|nr:uncharacterized protein N7520_005230 [Penicillium odoratum]KAJ5765671.1 hypothetical protein N7520_005230 [Penicillium odoratum]